jgi:hypothetical protein
MDHFGILARRTRARILIFSEKLGPDSPFQQSSAQVHGFRGEGIGVFVVVALASTWKIRSKIPLFAHRVKS